MTLFFFFYLLGEYRNPQYRVTSIATACAPPTFKWKLPPCYDVPVGNVKEELRFRCELEPFDGHSSEVPKHLAREASAHLAPLLLSGFHAEG